MFPLHTLCDDTGGDDKLRLMTNKFDDRFAERHPERSSRRVIHAVVITTCCVIQLRWLGLLNAFEFINLTRLLLLQLLIPNLPSEIDTRSARFPEAAGVHV